MTSSFLPILLLKKHALHKGHYISKHFSTVYLIENLMLRSRVNMLLKAGPAQEFNHRTSRGNRDQRVQLAMNPQQREIPIGWPGVDCVEFAFHGRKHGAFEGAVPDERIACVSFAHRGVARKGIRVEGKVGNRVQREQLLYQGACSYHWPREDECGQFIAVALPIAGCNHPSH